MLPTPRGGISRLNISQSLTEFHFEVAHWHGATSPRDTSSLTQYSRSELNKTRFIIACLYVLNL